MTQEDNQKPKVELRSEEVSDILGQIPHWILRWGMIMLLIAMAMVLLGSWWFKYPDIVPASVRVTTENPPYNAIARANGRISALLVKDNQQVTSGTVLAIIENPARYEDIQTLTSQLEEFRKISLKIDRSTDFTFRSDLVLGEVQPAFASFLKLYNDLLQYYKLDYYNQKITSLNQEITKYKDYSKRLANQSRILNQELGIITKQFKRDSTLYKQGVIPESDFEVSKTKVLEKQYQYEQSRITQAENEIQISKLEQQKLDMELKKNEETGKNTSLMLEAFDKLVASVADWKQKYILKSSVNGVVSFTRIWSENQNVREGELVMSVIPLEPGKIIGKISLPLTGSGKVKPDQWVNIRFSNYPYLEYGTVRGKIRTISLVTTDNAYSVVVDLPNGLKTNYDNELEFNQDMEGYAEIITSDKRLLEKVINPIKSVLNKQRQL